MQAERINQILTDFPSPEDIEPNLTSRIMSHRNALIAGVAALTLVAGGCTVQSGAERERPLPTVTVKVTPPVAIARPVAKPPKYAPYGVNDADQMRAGDRGPKVAKLRADLMVLKCPGVTPGNVADAATWEAVHVFQDNVGMSTNSYAYSVGPKTAKEIAAALRAKNRRCGATAVRHAVAKRVAPTVPKIAGCGNTYGPPVPGTVCPDGSIAAYDPTLPLGCPGSAKYGPAGPAIVACDARPGRPAGMYKQGVKVNY